ncbi:hypothetical protein EON77_11410 [bacterium]|nr:MAG: hypothetical protein EON77_11410 [bacterium]
MSACAMALDGDVDPSDPQPPGPFGGDAAMGPSVPSPRDAGAKGRDAAVGGTVDGGGAPAPADASGVPTAAQDAGQSAPAQDAGQSAPPVITSLSPASVAAGPAARTITVTGTGFASTATVRVDGVAAPTRWVSASTVLADLPAGSLATPGSREVRVFVPPPGGGLSGPQRLAVNAPGSCTDTTGVDIPLGAPGDVHVVTLDWANPQGQAPYFGSAGSCPVPIRTTWAPQPYLAWVVQNTSAVDLALTSWAVCPQGKSAYLSFYRRDTIPRTNAEIEACTNHVSYGDFSGVYLVSPEATSARYCPGLTKANGGAITLSPCEKAVVRITQYPGYAPPTLKISTALP